MRTEPKDIIEKRRMLFQKWNRLLATLVVFLVVFFFFIKIVFL